MTPEYYQKQFEPFKHFWQSDNEEWLKNRKEEWTILEENGLRVVKLKEKKLCKRYFLYGEINEYYPPVDLFSLTPFRSSADMIEFFNSNFMSGHERSEILSGYIYRRRENKRFAVAA